MFQGEWEQSDDDVTTHVDNSKHHIRQNDMKGNDDDDAMMWHSNSVTDSGPLLRRDYIESKLTKMERYLLV